VLIRSWNLFHGNSVPRQRAEFLDEMLRLAGADDPDVLCLQELPSWALGRFTAGDIAARPRIGPLPIPAELGRRLTDLNHGLLRSAFSGQGNAIQVSPRLRVLAHETLTLNPRRFRAAQSVALELGPVARLGWAKERRIVQALRLAEPGGRTFLVTNLHSTSYPADERLADAELLRAAWFAVSTAATEDVVVLAGDFNVRAARSRTRPYEKEEGEQTQHRLASGEDFTWPMAPGLKGEPIDLRQTPENPHYLDHAATLLDPARTWEWVTAINPKKRLILGYLFKREEYPWLQYWGNYPPTRKMVRGMEFGTQPFDVPRREAISTGAMFETPVYRWLPAKSKITTRFLVFYARAPDGFEKVDDVKIENGQIVIEDRAARKKVTLAASLGTQ